MADTLSENVLQAQFEGVPFPVTESSAKGSRAHAPHRAYRRPGADLENNGLNEYTGTLVAPMINTSDAVQRFGTVFPDLRDRLIARFEQTGVGRLVHPIRGPMDAMITEWPEVANAHSRGGTTITITWVEHNASSLVLLSEAVGDTPQDYESVTSTQALTADTAMRRVDPGNAASWTPVSPVVSTQLAALGSAASFGEIDTASRTMLAAITPNLALAAFAGADAHDVAVALYTLQATIFRLRDRLLGDLAMASTIVLPRSMAAWEIAQAYLGDASKADLILVANSFEDPLSIPAGASVRIPQVTV